MTSKIGTLLGNKHSQLCANWGSHGQVQLTNFYALHSPPYFLHLT